MKKHGILLTLLMLLLLPPALDAASTTFALRDDFNTLDNWRPFHFPNHKPRTLYQIERKGTEHYLKAVSHASASALIWKKTFNVYDYPKMKWRWKVSNVYRRGDMTKKTGDDYPLRIYVLFPFQPEKAGMLDFVKFDFWKQIFGEYPPQSALNYIWANRDDEAGRVADSVFQSQTKIIVLQAGTRNLGKWIEERVDILDDYQKAFGSKPPPTATIGIMNDSDNTGEQSVSYLAHIEVYRAMSVAGPDSKAGKRR